MTCLDLLVDVVTVVGLALFSVAVVLVLLQRITLSNPVPAAARMIVFEAAPFALGAAVARDVFSRASDEPGQREQRPGRRDRDEETEATPGTVSDLGASPSFSAALLERAPARVKAGRG